MNLKCAESGKIIYFVDDDLVAATRGDVNFYAPICRAVLNRIPGTERRKERCEPHEGGVDIYDHRSFTKSEWPIKLNGTMFPYFRFSLSQEAAELYLPNHINQYPNISG